MKATAVQFHREAELRIRSPVNLLDEHPRFPVTSEILVTPKSLSQVWLQRGNHQ